MITLERITPATCRGLRRRGIMGGVHPEEDALITLRQNSMSEEMQLTAADQKRRSEDNKNST